MKILIIEDEVELLESISAYLKKTGYLCEIADSYFSAEEKLAVYAYDLVLLDITLPGGNGLELIKLIRNLHPETGILIISAKNSLDDKLSGLDLGADDYLTKPFFLAELNSRVNALLRRKNFKGQNRIQFNEIEIDPTAMLILVENTPLNLTKKEYDLLLYLVINKNRVLTKEAIAEHVWGDHIDSADNLDFVYTHIKNLRKKIEIAGGKDYLKTVYGMGYKYTDQ